MESASDKVPGLNAEDGVLRYRPRLRRKPEIQRRKETSRECEFGVSPELVSTILG